MAEQFEGDNLLQVWKRFYDVRVADAWHRFNGWYRAQVVETNDPLQLQRIRFKIPELHDYNLAADDLPWAVAAPWLGVRGAQSWANPMIGDWVWVFWEKNCPFAPIWVSFATPTRRKFYALESVFTKSPLSVDQDGKQADKPDDYLEEYLSKDHRPYSVGWRDRYGTFAYSHSVGYHPVEHTKDKPAPVGFDAVQKSEFEAQGAKPEVNDPDVKLWALCTKYGCYVVHSDTGYWWKKDEEKDPELGEFTGDFDKDFDFEVKRSKYLRKHFNEQKEKDRDQRRFEIRTRYGHKVELRDVGWAQKGPVKSKSRQDEYDEPRLLSQEEERDEAWIKWRTKNGHLFQMWDKGVNYDKDTYVKRLIKEEVGGAVDGEDEYWAEKDDARWTRLLTRWGLKIVMDDRGVHYTEAEKHVKPRANGLLFKGRRLVDEKIDGPTGLGFAYEFCEKKQLNKLSAYSPRSKILELNDRKDYAIVCTDMTEPISEAWQGLKGHEFALSMAMTYDPEQTTHHLKLDLANEYLRLKTRAGRGQGSRGEDGSQNTPSPNQAVNQGLEARDGELFGGAGETWVEVNDADDRGLWLSHDKELVVLRARTAPFDGKPPKNMHVVLDEQHNVVMIINGEQEGKIQLQVLSGNVEIQAKNVAVQATDVLSFKAGTKICFEGGGAHAVLERGAFGTDVDFNAPRTNAVHTGCEPGGDAGDPSPMSCVPLQTEITDVEELYPRDRAAVKNSPFDRQPESVLEKPDDDAGESGR